MNDHDDRKYAEAAVRKINYRMGKTNTAEALRLARTVMFTPVTGDRALAQNMAIIITGKSCCNISSKFGNKYLSKLIKWPIKWSVVCECDILNWRCMKIMKAFYLNSYKYTEKVERPLSNWDEELRSERWIREIAQGCRLFLRLME